MIFFTLLLWVSFQDVAFMHALDVSPVHGLLTGTTASRWKHTAVVLKVQRPASTGQAGWLLTTARAKRRAASLTIRDQSRYSVYIVHGEPWGHL